MTSKITRAFALLIAAGAALLSCTSQSLTTTYNNQSTKIDSYVNNVTFIERELGVTQTNDTTYSYTLTNVDTITPRLTTNKGASRISIIEGEGDQLSSKGKVEFYYAGYIFTTGPSTVQMLYLTAKDDDGTDYSSWLFSTPYSSINVSGTTDTGATISGSSSSSGLTIFATNHYLTAQLAGMALDDADYSTMTLKLSNSDIIEGLRYGLVGVRAGEVCDIAFSAELGFEKQELGTIPANSALLYRIWVVSVSN